MKYVNPHTLVRAGSAIGLGDTMFLRECVGTPLISRGDSLHHRIRMVFNWINERDRCDARRAEDTKPQGRLSGRFRYGGVENLRHSNGGTSISKIHARCKIKERGLLQDRLALRTRRVKS